MSHFVWSSEYDLGIEVIDQQHKRIIDYINRVYEALDGESSQQEINAILKYLVDYTFSHLAFEEAMLEEVGYQDFAAHQLTHKTFSQLINHLQRRAQQGEAVGSELATFLQDWLIAHIMVEDAKYVEAVRATLLSNDTARHRHWLRDAVCRYFQ